MWIFDSFKFQYNDLVLKGFPALFAIIAFIASIWLAAHVMAWAVSSVWAFIR